MNSRTLNLYVAALFIGQCIYTLALYRQAPYGDQFDFIPILAAFAEGGEWIERIFARHGDHWHLGPYVLMLVLGEWTGWNLFWEAVLILAFSLLTWIFIYKSVELPSGKNASWALAIGLVTIATIYFSTANARNLLWTWQLAVYTTTFGMALTVWGLLNCRAGRPTWLYSVAGAILASLSFSNGFVLWPLGILALLMNRKLTSRETAYLAGLWLLAGASVAALFMLETQGRFSQGIQFGLANIEYLLVYIGTGLLTAPQGGATILGAAGIVSAAAATAYLCLTRNTLSRNVRVAVCLALFAIGCGLLTSAGRTEVGVQQALTARYVTFSQFFWIGIGILLVELAGTSDNKSASAAVPAKLLTTAAVVLLAVVIVNAIKVGIDQAQRARHFNRQALALLSGMPPYGEEALSVFDHPRPAAVNQGLRTLQALELNVYRPRFQRSR